jgi:hypothetical protein
MSLALANQMRKFAHAPEYVEQVDDYWTLDWWKRLALNEDTSDDPFRIGQHSIRGTR